MASSKIDWRDVGLHLFAGASLVAAALLPPAQGGFLLATELGVWREWSQHGAPGWWTLHVWAEALAWPLGALLAAWILG